MTIRQSSAFGRICHTGGRQIEVTAPYQPWLDWAGRALDTHDEMLAALKAAQFAFGFGSSATPEQQQKAAEQITAAIRRAERGL
jgi:hypothetical protein